MPQYFDLILGAALLLLTWVVHRVLTRAIHPRPYPERLECYPSVSVIRPIKGLDVEAEENLRAGLDTGYPGEVQILFVFDDEEEPALPIVRAAIEAHRSAGGSESIDVLFCGQPGPHRTGKLNAMIAGMREATGELVAFVDSDVRTDREVLRVTVETLMADEKAGCAFAPVVVGARTRTVGDAGMAVMLNSIYTPPALMLADANDGKFPFILGQFMVFRREAIAAIGGFESTEGQLCDDLYIGQLTHQAGWNNLLAPHWVRIIQYGRGPREAYAMLVRWITFSRTAFPGISFLLQTGVRVIFFWIAFWGAIVSAVQGSWLAALLFVATGVAVTISLNIQHHKLGADRLAPRHWPGAALMVIFMQAAVVHVYVLQKSSVNWRGREYSLSSGRLEAGSGDG